MAEPLKNMYNTEFITALSEAILSAYESFNVLEFTHTVFDDDWEARELKARVRHVADSLRRNLPTDYRNTLAILSQASQHKSLAEYGYAMIIFSEFVELFGLDDWEASLPAMAEFTVLCSSEFAVRPFILQDTKRMMAQMLAWTEHPNEHVRRLASEGCRPRLPWGMVLKPFTVDPAPILPILEKLKQDESEYVRRSVANNLNDIAKDNPQVVIDTLQRWQAIDTPDMRWITNHGLRTLIKQGDPAALELLGYSQHPAVDLHNLSLTPNRIAIGEGFTFTFELRSTSEQGQDIIIDYIVQHVRANGQRTPKVFKLAKKHLPANDTLSIKKKHALRIITTRKYYAGTHRLEIQVNGQVLGGADFEVTA